MNAFVSRATGFRVSLSRQLSVRFIHGPGATSKPTHDAQFQKAKIRLDALRNEPSKNVKLRIHGLYQQATVGKCDAPKPGLMDFTGQAQWSAWNSLGDMSQADAQNAYINLVNELVGQEPDTGTGNPDSGIQYEGFAITRDKENKIYTIRLNRPAKKNAVTTQMYKDFGKCLREAADNDAYSIVVMTGTGDYYCSGNDLTNFSNYTPDRIPELAKEGRLLLSQFVNSLIDFPKPLVSLVNGSAVGISVTALGLCDAVYASDKATFHTPVSALCQSPDACSSYIFPKLMGPVKANELLMFNRKITAKEAKERNLVSEVIPDALFEKETTEKMKQYAKLPTYSLKLSKMMHRYVELDTLKKVNEQECKLLEERWKSQEYIQAVMDLINESKSKSKKSR